MARKRLPTQRDGPIYFYLEMDFRNSSTVPLDFDSICTTLEKIDITNYSENDLAELISNSTPLDEKVRLLLRVLTSDKSDNVRMNATAVLKTIFTEWLTKKNIPSALTTESRSCITNQILIETNPTQQKDLISICLILIRATIKDEAIKWDIITEFVIKLVSANQPHLTDMLSHLLKENHLLFGVKKRKYSIQYSKFLTECFKAVSYIPQIGLFALDMWQYLFCCQQSHYCKKKFIQLIPLLMDALDVLSQTSYGYEFVKRLKLTFYFEETIFQDDCKRFIRRIVVLLYMVKVESCVETELYEFLKLLQGLKDKMESGHSSRHITMSRRI